MVMQHSYIGTSDVKKRINHVVTYPRELSPGSRSPISVELHEEVEDPETSCLHGGTGDLQEIPKILETTTKLCFETVCKQKAANTTDYIWTK